MQPTSSWKTFYLSYLSKPKSDRDVYRAILRRRPTKILELGVGDAKRAQRMIEAAAKHVDRAEIQYFGFDSFEGRAPGEGVGLAYIEAHRIFKTFGCKTKLLPGNPLDSFVRSVNMIGPVDFVVFSAPYYDQADPRFWQFFARILVEQTVILGEIREENDVWFERLTRADVLAKAPTQDRRRAA